MTILQTRPFNLRPVCREAPAKGPDLRATHRTAAANYWYIVRENGHDLLGPTPDFHAKRADLVDSGREAPLRGPAPSLAACALWQAADVGAAAHRPDQASAFHIVASLPEGDAASWRALVQAYGQAELCANGMVADWAIHARDADGPGSSRIAPHVHLLVTARSWRAGRRPGQRHPRWFTHKAQIRGAADRWYAMSGLYPQIAVDWEPVAGC